MDELGRLIDLALTIYHREGAPSATAVHVDFKRLQIRHAPLAHALHYKTFLRARTVGRQRHHAQLQQSQLLLRRVVAEITARGFNIANIDASVIAEKPKIYPHLAAMKAALARSTGLLPDEIGLKATTNEGVDDIGRGLAIAAHAVALLSRS